MSTNCVGTSGAIAGTDGNDPTTPAASLLKLRKKVRDRLLNGGKSDASSGN